jgi:ParB-like chromosome segregation protein Spo0J
VRVTEVHPVAALFPMLADDELTELAEDIKQRGLLQPIVLDPEGRILDGRNRLAACELAGIEPSFITYEGDDPNGYALAVNIARRHLRPGQRYILVEKARRLTKVRKVTLASSAGEKLGLSEASVVLDFAPDLAAAVLANAISLDAAASAARERKREVAEINAKKDRLRKAAPDLLNHVDEERLDLDEAIAALDAREEKARREEAERLEQEKQAQETAKRLATLPADLATRVADGQMDFAEAESVVKERAERLDAWAEQISRSYETFRRMVGYPIPAELKEKLTDEVSAGLGTIVSALENGEQA